MARRDLSAYLDDTIVYEGIRSQAHPGGKTYTVPCVDARTGVWLSAIADVGLKAAVDKELSNQEVEGLKLDDDEEKTFYQRVLGPVYEEMVADGVSWSLLQFVGRDAYLNFAIGQDFADQALKVALEAAAGEAVAPQAGAPLLPTQRKPRTPRKPAGSSSKKGSTAIRARTPARASTPSSTSPNGSVDEPAAATG